MRNGVVKRGSLGVKKLLKSFEDEEENEDEGERKPPETICTCACNFCNTLPVPKQKITLETLCWTPELEKSFAPFRGQGLLPARVAVEDKLHYVLFNAQEPLIGKISGKLEY